MFILISLSCRADFGHTFGWADNVCIKFNQLDHKDFECLQMHVQVKQTVIIIVSYKIQERLATLRWLMTSPAIARPNCLNMSAKQRPSLCASPPWVSSTTPVRKGWIFFTLEEYQAILENMFAFSWRIGVSWHRARSTRLCSQVLHWRGQLGPDWQQHPHFLHQGCPVGECEALKTLQFVP